MVRVCVLFAAGTNCDRETVCAFKQAGAAAEKVHINQLKTRERFLSDYQILVIPGGFSYGDYISSGKILANELTHNLKQDLVRFHANGKLVLGICNGFQVLIKAGLLPAFDWLFETQTVTLDTNDSGRFEDRWVHLRTNPSCIFTRGLDEICELPVAHAEGKFIPKDQKILNRLKEHNQIVFRYVTGDGEPADYPDNPNGSVDGIAGICDPSGRILGMMPHPERFVRTQQHPRWHRERLTKPAGIVIFENAVNYIKENL